MNDENYNARQAYALRNKFLQHLEKRGWTPEDLHLAARYLDAIREHAMRDGVDRVAAAVAPVHSLVHAYPVQEPDNA